MFGIIRKFNTILSKKQKKIMAVLIIMMIIGALLETCSVSMIVPLVSLIVQPDVMTNNIYVVELCSVFHIESLQQLVVVVMLGLALLFLFKNIFLLLQNYVQARFAGNNRFMFQERLFHYYLYRPYEFFLNTNPSTIQQYIVDDVNASFILLQRLLAMITEIFTSILLVVTVYIIEPKLSIFITILLIVTVFVIYYCVKPVMQKCAAVLSKYTILSRKWLNQSLLGIKEVKISGKQDFFCQQFSYCSKKTIDVEVKNSVLESLPRLLIETVSVCGVLIVFALMIMQGREITGMLPYLSAFAMTAIRLIPSANRISNYMNQISYREPLFDRMLHNLDELESSVGDYLKKDYNASDKLSINRDIRLEGITYNYEGSKQLVLDDVNMVIPVGSTVGIIGTSGAGKTTAVDILLGLLAPQSGKVTADGFNVMDNYSLWLSHIGYIPQTIYMLDDTIRANVAFGYKQSEVDDDYVWNVLKQARLDDFVKGLPKGLDTTIGDRGMRLSGGQRQRLGIARALYSNPDLLVFDEATSALDNQTEAEIMDSIEGLHGKKTMVIIAHRLGTIKNCDIVYKVQDGKVERER